MNSVITEKPAKSYPLLQKRAESDIKMIILHHTGMGIFRRKELSPLDSAIKVYTQLMDFSPHFLIGYDGEIIRFVDDDLIAWHAGAANSRVLMRKYIEINQQEKIKHKWLRENQRRFKSWQMVYGDNSPLIFDDKLNFNRHSIGIELLAVRSEDYYYVNQLRALRGLVNVLTNKYKIIQDKFHITTHSFCQPYSRITQSGTMWDPPEAKFNLLKFLG